VEASVSMLILFGLVLGLYQQRIEKPDIASQMYKIQHQILAEASEDYCIRNEVLNYNYSSLNTFIASRLCTMPYSFTTRLCNATDACLSSDVPPNTEIYSDNIIIAANLTKFNPVKIAFFAWQGSTQCQTYFCNITSQSGGVGPGAVCGNGIIESGEECEGSSTNEIWYNDKGRTENCKRIYTCQSCKWVMTKDWSVGQEGVGIIGVDGLRSCTNNLDDDCDGGVDTADSGCIT